MIGRVCILTDNSAQFPVASFPGHELVNVIPLHVQINGHHYPESRGVRAHDLPVTARFGLQAVVLPPSADEFRRMYAYLGQIYDEIVVLLLSSSLNPAVTRALEAAESVQGRTVIHVVDTKTMAVGLGLLTQAAAQAASGGLAGTEIVRLIRGLIPHIYAMFCIPGLTYLHQAGLVGAAQALVGEKLGIMPLFIMENGQLVAVQKARSSRHLVDCLHEFVCEFRQIEHIAVVQGVPPYEQEVRALRERISLDLGTLPISEHIIGAAPASMLGPHSLGLYVLEGERT